jgi:transmembrane sensor
MVERTADRERLEQAAQWHLALLDDDVSTEAFSRMLAWCDADPLNREALERIQQTSAGMGVMAHEADAAIQHALREVAAEGSLRQAGQGPLAAIGRWWGRRVRPMHWAIGAGAAVTAGLALWLVVFAPLSTDERVEHLASTRKALEPATLPDGSTIELGGSSAVSVLYTRQNRLLVAEDGEAFYRVHKDRARPFIVRAGPLTATAVGTAFSVRRDGQSVSVLVTEGVVEIRLDGEAGAASAAAPLRVAAGQLVRYDRGRLSAAPLPGANTDQGAAWRSGRLQFVDEPLRLVVAAINRYADREIVITDSPAEELRFTGTVFMPQLDDWLAAIATVYPVKVTRGPDKRVLIATAKSGAP